MPHADNKSDLAKTDILSEAAFAELVHQNRAKVYSLTGRLVRDDHQLTLRMDDGGQWCLDDASSLHRHVGQRVTLEGTRLGFNAISITCFKPEGTDWPPRQTWLKKLRARLIYWLAFRR